VVRFIHDDRSEGRRPLSQALGLAQSLNRPDEDPWSAPSPAPLEGYTHAQQRVDFAELGRCLLNQLVAVRQNQHTTHPLTS
jgi:hypothetical protein